MTLQARILEWVAMPSSRDLSDLGAGPASLMSPALAGVIVLVIYPGDIAVSQTLVQVNKRRSGFPWASQAWGVEVEGGFLAPQSEAALPGQEAAVIRGTARSQASDRERSTT